MQEIVHYSVLKNEVDSYLNPLKDNALLIDGTLGEGGHSEMFLSRHKKLNVIGLDADREISRIAGERLAVFGERMRIINTWFNNFFHDYPSDIEKPDYILLDLGISMFHYNKSGRGFTFRNDEKLDMRLNKDLEISAYDVVNTYPENEIADIIFEFGEERYSRRIARAIVEERKNNDISSSAVLADIIKRAMPKQARYGKIHPATKSFQALRIFVNGELERLKSALEDGLSVLKKGGRMGVISFHSLEDRIVKNVFRDKCKACSCPSEWDRCECSGKAAFKLVVKKPVIPTEEEIKENPASRSSKLRVIEKIA